MLSKIRNIFFHKKQKFNQSMFCLFRPLLIKTLPQKDLDLITSKIKNSLFTPETRLNESSILKTANLAADNCFNILGKQICFKNNINWHQDFKTTEIIPEWKTGFYKNIKIKTKHPKNTNVYYSDAKVPWELSRLQHLPRLGEAFKQTMNNNYLNTFIKHLNDWIDKNSFLYGINWVCPMDVAIRAINIIHGMNYFKKDISKDLFDKIINSLYQHAIYLENNWELFYKNNNHYLTDLLSYFYLSLLFEDLKHFKKAKTKIFKKILKQFDEQIMQDGTCYEGSTSYHKLVTEIFILFQNLCINNQLKLPSNFVKRLNKAKQFIKDCTDSYGNFVQIGDNDSGQIIKNKKTFSETVLTVSHYSNFGLTIIKNKDWHITYRHPTYKKTQPSGHFHQDALSITISYKGIPILVDPGTGLYTPNKKIRDKFRSYSSHNNFCIYNEKTESQNIFLLNKKEQTDTSQVRKINKKIEIKNYYKQIKNKLFRKLLFNNEDKIEIIDWIENINSNEKATWNFIFHPKIEIKLMTQDNLQRFKIIYNKKTLFILKSNLELKLRKSSYSSSYGIIETCYKLCGKKAITQKKIITTLETIFSRKNI